MRSDTRRNFRRMIESAREVLGSQPDTANMAEIAAHAEVSLATAYRYFPSLSDLISATILDSVEALREFSAACPATGEELMHEVMLHWITMVQEQGPVLVHLRSRKGFLERLFAGDPVITVKAEAWARPVQEFLGELDTQSELPRVLMYLNQISDPREILDLSQHGVSNPTELARTMTETFRAGVRAWLDTTSGIVAPVVASSGQPGAVGPRPAPAQR